MQNSAANEPGKHNDDAHVRCELDPHLLIPYEVDHNKHSQHDLTKEAKQHMQKDIRALGFANLEFLLPSFEICLLLNNFVEGIFVYFLFCYLVV